MEYRKRSTRSCNRGSFMCERTERYRKFEKQEGQKVKNWSFPCKENWRKVFDLQQMCISLLNLGCAVCKWHLQWAVLVSFQEIGKQQQDEYITNKSDNDGRNSTSVSEQQTLLCLALSIRWPLIISEDYFTYFYVLIILLGILLHNYIIQH